MRRAIGLLMISACLAPSAAATESPHVTFELVTRPNVPLTAQQQWYRVLSSLGLAGVRIRAGTTQDQPAATATASGYRVVGVLGADNTLYLPGGRFAVSDTARLRKWIDQLAEGGAESVTEPRAAFGLSERQLTEVMADLRRPLAVKTRDQPAADVLRQAARQLATEIVNQEVAQRALVNAKVADELQGVSAGTALAAILRPAGLVLRPKLVSGGKPAFEVARAEAGRESWPIGWKSKAKPSKVLPALFDFLNVEIAEIPVSEALEAVEGRLKVPFLYDRNALAAHGIDPAGVQAEVPSKRMTYSQVLHKILNQAKLKYELRVDEADQPFVWITTVRAIE